MVDVVVLRRREAPRGRGAIARSAAAFVGSERSRVGAVESGKPAFGFPLFHPPSSPELRGMWESRLPLGEISKGLVERVGSLLLAFHPFHSPGISAAQFGLFRGTSLASAEPVASGLTTWSGRQCGWFAQTHGSELLTTARSAAVSPAPSTNRSAIAVRHCLTRRCRVRSCPGAKDVEVSSWSRRNNPLALASGCSLSHRSTSGQTSWKGSTRVRHGRGPVYGLRWVERTSPSRQAVERLATNSARSCFLSAGSLLAAPTSC